MEVSLSTFRTAIPQASTSRPSLCSRDRGVILERDIPVYHRTLEQSISLVYAAKWNISLTVRTVLVFHIQLAKTEVAQRNVPRII